jgi:hypothetical protein
MASDEMRPARLWRGLSSDLKLSSAAAFWRDEQARLEQAEAASLIAQHIKFRPKSVRALPIEKKAKHLVGLPQISDLMAARLLVAYHLAHQRPMMGRFLDALGIAHDQGLITEEEPKAPEADKLDQAVAVLTAEFPKADVARYFWTLLWQDPETWGGLEGRPELALDLGTQEPRNPGT